LEYKSLRIYKLYICFGVFSGFKHFSHFMILISIPLVDSRQSTDRNVNSARVKSRYVKSFEETSNRDDRNHFLGRIEFPTRTIGLATSATRRSLNSLESLDVTNLTRWPSCGARGEVLDATSCNSYGESSLSVIVSRYGVIRTWSFLETIISDLYDTERKTQR